MKKFLLLLIVVALSSGCVQQSPPVACTADAKICPDGTAVGRVPPDCEFAPCPPLNCTSFSVERCPQECYLPSLRGLQFPQLSGRGILRPHGV
ncbi:MAG: hypothetical protein LUO93_01260 [Methanomicrobiales archaeon]|nr:hypothetical protein [Methanomicrobiales archaeon]